VTCISEDLLVGLVAATNLNVIFTCLWYLCPLPEATFEKARHSSNHEGHGGNRRRQESYILFTNDIPKLHTRQPCRKYFSRGTLEVSMASRDITMGRGRSRGKGRPFAVCASSGTETTTELTSTEQDRRSHFALVTRTFLASRRTFKCSGVAFFFSTVFFLLSRLYFLSPFVSLIPSPLWVTERLIFSQTPRQIRRYLPDGA
jgi:hypothetical protein